MIYRLFSYTQLLLSVPSRTLSGNLSLATPKDVCVQFILSCFRLVFNFFYIYLIFLCLRSFFTRSSWTSSCTAGSSSMISSILHLLLCGFFFKSFQTRFLYPHNFGFRFTQVQPLFLRVLFEFLSHFVNIHIVNLFSWPFIHNTAS